MTRAPSTKRQLTLAVEDVSRAVERVLGGATVGRAIEGKLRAAQTACVEGYVVRDPRTFQALSRLRNGWDKLRLVRSLARRKTSGITELEVAAVRSEIEQQLRACQLAASETPLADLAEEACDAHARR